MMSENTYENFPFLAKCYHVKPIIKTKYLYLCLKKLHFVLRICICIYSYYCNKTIAKKLTILNIEKF